MKRQVVHEMGIEHETLCGLEKKGPLHPKNPIVQGPASSTVTCPKCIRLAKQEPR